MAWLGVFAISFATFGTSEYRDSGWLAPALLFGMIANAVGYVLGLPFHDRKAALLVATYAAGAMVIAVVVFSGLTELLALPRTGRVSVVAGLAAAAWLTLWNLARTWGHRATSQMNRVALIAPSQVHAAFVRNLASAADPMLLTGVYDLEDFKLEDFKHDDVRLGRLDAATVIVLAPAYANDPDLFRYVLSRRAAGVEVHTLNKFHDHYLEREPIDLYDAAVTLEHWDAASKPTRFRRFADVCGALALMPLLLLTIPAVVVVNRFGNRGPLFFKQQRVGRDGALFEMYKFRTMVPVESSIGEWTAKADKRITPVGRTLRRLHLDEIPQLINILKGDLAFIGPRPEQPHYVEMLRQEIPHYDLRHLVKPGLTGWAQVTAGYASSIDETAEKLACDLYYVRNRTIGLDLRIVVRTVRGCLLARGSR